MSVEKVTTEIVMMPEMRNELPSASQNGIASNTFAAFTRKLPPGMRGSVSPRVALVPLATTTDHHSGYTLPMMNAASRP